MNYDKPKALAIPAISIIESSQTKWPPIVLEFNNLVGPSPAYEADE
jgi:hypothetical protein